MSTMKRCISFLLALVMVAGLLPQFILLAGAESLPSESVAFSQNSESRSDELVEHYEKTEFMVTPEKDSMIEPLAQNVGDIDSYPVIEANTETTAKITEAGQYAYFRFTPKYTQSYTFYSMGNSDTYGCLYDSEMNQLTYDDDTGEGSNFSIVYTLEAGKTYVLAAKYYRNSAVGSFTVILQAKEVLDITADTETMAEIVTRGAYAYFRFTPERTESYTFYSITDMPTYGILYDSEMNELANDVYSGEGNNFSIKYILTAGRTYYMAAGYDSGDRVGSFPVMLKTNDEAENVIAIEADTKTMVEITAGGQYAYFYFTPKFTESYTFYSKADDDTYGYLYDGGMNELAYNDDDGEGNNFSITYTLTAGQTYILAARYLSGNQVGTFPVVLQTNDELKGCFAIQPDTETWAEIESGGARAYFRFTPEYTESYTFYSMEYNDTFGYLYDSEMNLLASDDESGERDNFAITYTLDAGQTYVFCARYYNSPYTAPILVMLKTNHEGEGFVKVPATCTTDGEMEYTCSACGLVYTEAIYGQHDVNDENVCTSCGIYIYSYGTCGDNLTWVLGADGVLIISGSGEMHYSRVSYTPWYDDRNAIRSVIIGNSVTTIDSQAFIYCRNLANVTIGDNVTTIGDSAFFDCRSLESVTIPDRVTTIGDGAFDACTSLNSVTISDSVTTIGDGAFEGCSSLTSVTIPVGVTDIGEGIFADCDSLTEINVDENNPNYSNDEQGVLFDKEKTELIQAPGTISGSYEIPAGVTTIGYSAFQGCAGLSSVTIPDSVTRIGGSAFWYCKNLKSVTIPNSVVAIREYTFLGCENLTQVTIPDSVTSIGKQAFSDCDKLTTMEIGAGVTSIGDYAFIRCGSLRSINVDENNPNYSSDERGVLFDKEKTKLILAPSAISGAYGIPDSVTTIYDYAFSSCDGLTSVTIPDSVTNIGREAFSDCYSLTNVEIGEGVTAISHYAFQYCSKLTSVIIPAHVTTIGSGILYGCTDMSEITFIGKAPDFEDYSFNDVRLTAYYPDNDTTWTDDILQNYGGTITWVSYTPECTDHSYEAVVTASTCTEPGYTTYTCSACGDSYVADEVAPTGHIEGEAVRENEVAATCISEGSYEEVIYCTACGVEISCKSVTTSIIDHSYDAEITDPTCTEGGFTTYTCSVCSDSYVADEVDPLGHNFEDGVCTRCGEVEPTEPEEEPITITSQPSDYVGMVGDTATFTVVAEGEGLKYQWYCSTDGGVNWGTTGVTGDTQSVVFLAYRNNQLYRCVITDAEGNTVTTDAAELKAQEIALEITGQPENYIGAVGDEASFTLAANGNGLTYEWFVSSDGGATWAKSYMTGYMSETQTAVLRPYRDGYKLYCKVSDVFGNTVNSDIVSMTVKSSEVKINSQPQSIENAAIQQMYAFTVEAEGDNLTYLWEVSTNGGATWEQSWSDGYNTDTLNIRMYQYRDGYQYRCVVTSGLKTVVVTEAATLKLQAPSVVIETSPVSVYALLYEEVTMHAAATGMDLTYQWYYSTDDGATWVENWMTGYNTDTLTFVAIPTRAALYMCKVTDGSGTSVWTEPAQMKILSAELQITSEPENFTGKVGDTASFTVAAEGEGVSYRWYLSSDGGETWSECWFDGYNTNRLSFYINASRAANQYRCVITDVAGNTVTSSTVTVVAE